jgi:hypothetical protein
MVDCLFWDHVMQALTDIHLIVVLADFPTILKFTQGIWEKYSFGTIIEDLDIQSTASVWVWNMEENAMNAFANIPLLPSKKHSECDDSYGIGVDLKNNLNMLQNDLGKSIALAKHQRSTMSYQIHRNVPAATWNRWRMGGGFLPSRKVPGTDTTASGDNGRREYQRNDEIWMMSVAFTTIVAMVGFGLVG